MDQATPSKWHKLYPLAKEFNALAAWQWMAETDLFGIEDPETGAVAYVSVMGEGGVHCGIAAYLGTRGLHGFFRLLAGEGGPEDLLLVPQMMASFEDRADLWRRDLAVIKEEGVRFRGRGQWLLLRIFTPGWEPWFLSAGHVRFFSIILEQGLVIAERCRHGLDLTENLDSGSCLTLSRRRRGKTLQWSEEVIPFPDPGQTRIDIHVGMDLMEQAQRLPTTLNDMEIGHFTLPVPIGKRGARGQYGTVLLLADARSGMILGI